MVDGGRPVSHARSAAEPRMMRLPRLARSEGRLIALDAGIPVQEALEARRRALARMVARVRPDVVLVDHYPFSKWELESELHTALDEARQCNPEVRILCSLRDVVRKTRYEQSDRRAYERRILAELGARFDGILVHADPTFTRLEEHFARCADLPVPVRYTGFVAHRPPSVSRTKSQRAYGVLSCGGGSASLAFLLNVMRAFEREAVGGGSKPMPLLVFPGAFVPASDIESLKKAAAGSSARIQSFGPLFGPQLAGSKLSISRAGYNTCVAILQSRVRAVLVPDPVMSDQAVRARRLAELGLAVSVEGNPSGTELGAAIQTALSGPRPRHGLDLDGVRHTRALIEASGRWTRRGSASRLARPAKR